MPGVAPEADPARWSDPTALDTDALGARWDVWDHELGRRVIRVEPAAELSSSHLRQVAAAIRALRHPHLCLLYGVQDGPPLRYVRDSVPGGHIGDRDLRSDSRATAWLAQCASALMVLHQQGFAHGGLVAEAIRLTPDGRVVLVAAGGRPDAAPDDDWRALAAVFHDLPAPVGDVVARLASVTDPLTGPELLAWLLALRDPGAGGGSRYERRGLLGIGGMGEVWKVYDPLLERIVAQKVLAGSLLSRREAITGFLGEARITAQLQHPGIVPVHDLESLPNGAVAFTMKQIDGRTLSEVIREVHAASRSRWRTGSTGWSLRRLVDALRRACDAIAYAHDQGVMHLDLKPGNVMVGEYGEVVVVDWGLARRIGQGPDASGVFRHGVGTAGYMAPEQSTAGSTLGPAADIYALGASLREVLDGVSPDTAGTETAEAAGTARAQWVPRHGRAPRELVSIVRRATRIDPAERYASAKQLAADLAAWQDERLVAAHAYSFTEVLRRRLRPHQAPIIVSVLAAVVLVAVGVVTLVRLDAANAVTEEMTAQALVDRANLALDAHDHIRAEAYAATAVGLTDRAEARGLLAQLTRGWRPELVERWPVACAEVVVVGTPAAAFCATDHSVGPLPVDASDPRVYSGRRTRLGVDGVGGWTGVANASVVSVDAATGQQRWSIVAPGPVSDAVVLPGGEVVVAVGRDVLFYDAAHAVHRVVRMDTDVLDLAECGPDAVAVGTASSGPYGGGGLFVIDRAPDSEPRSVRADRVSPPIRCSPDGRFLAVPSDDAVQVWDVTPRLESPIQRGLLVGHLGAITAIAWSDDGDTLATASQDRTVRLWDDRSGVEIGRLPASGPVHDVALVAGAAGTGGLIVATGNEVQHWALPEMHTVASFSAVVDVMALSWAARVDGAPASLFTLDRFGRPQVFDSSTGRERLSVYLQVVDMDPNADGLRVVVATDEGDLGVVDLDENTILWRRTRPHADAINTVAWRPGHEQFVSGAADGSVWAWDVGASEPAWRLGLGPPITGLRWSADGRALAVRLGGEEPGVTLLDAGGKKLGLDLGGDFVAHALAPAGDALALAWRDAKLTLMERNRGTWASRSIVVDGAVVGVDFSPAGDPPLVASVTREGLVQVFDVATGRERARVFAHPRGATDLAFSLDGTVLASSGVDGDIVLLDVSVIRADGQSLKDAVEARYGANITSDLGFP